MRTPQFLAVPAGLLFSLHHAEHERLAVGITGHQASLLWSIVLAVAVGYTIPMVALMLVILPQGFGFPIIPLTSTLLVVLSIAAAIALFRFGLLEISTPRPGPCSTPLPIRR